MFLCLRTNKEDHEKLHGILGDDLDLENTENCHVNKPCGKWSKENFKVLEKCH